MPHAVSVSPDFSNSALERIRSLSRPFRMLFSGLFIGFVCICVCLVLATLLYNGPHFRLSNDLVQQGQGHMLFVAEPTEEVLTTSVAIGDVPMKKRLVGIVSLGILQWGSLIMIFLHFRELFRLYERGLVFSHANVVCIRRIGFWLILWGLAPTVGHQLTVWVGVNDTGWFRMSSVAGVVLGGLLYVIARVMNLGRVIEQEKARFV